MKKVFTKHLVIYMAIAMIVTVFAIFGYQTVVNNVNNTKSSNEKLDQVEEKLKSNDAEIEKLTTSLGENNLAKTKAFAHIIALDSSIVSNASKMDTICKELMVNELHVIDDKGIIVYSTVPEYVGFDMGSGDQSRVFLDILKDPSLEIVQEPQVNAAEGVVIQYIGVATHDGKGLVQVGIKPEVLEEMLESTAIDVVLKDFDFGSEGYIFAIDKETDQILAHKNDSLIGKSASEAGFPANMGADKGKAKVDGEKGYYVTREYEGMIIGTMMPNSEYYQVRLSQTIVVSISMFLIFLVLLFMINRLVDKKMVKGIQNIINGLQTITKGNLDMVVDEKGNPEFELLSNSINQMVGSIKTNLSQNDELLKKQKADMENNLQLIQNVKDVCINIDRVSRETLVNSQEIRMGTSEQEQTVEELKEIMNQLSAQLTESADVSGQISQTTEEAVKRLMQTKERMGLLETSIDDISNTSLEIEKIIGEINSIAEQTNLLSLNASIEAARAGEAGRGFAIVASQVGELAARSAQAAKETGDLIMNSIQAVNSGKELTHQAVDEFLEVVGDIQHASDGVGQITGMVKEHVQIVSEAVDGFDKISEVVERNVEISRKSEEASENMAHEANMLQEIVK